MVKSRPMPTFFPGWIRVPTWRTSILPARTVSPPKTFTPRLWPWLSRPLRELPPAFLCAIRAIPPLGYFKDFERRLQLAVAALPAVALAPLHFKDQDLFRLALVHDLRRDFDVRESRRADFDLAVAAGHEHVGEHNPIADLARQTLDLHHVSGRDAVLLAAGPDNHI